MNFKDYFDEDGCFTKAGDLVYLSEGSNSKVYLVSGYDVIYRLFTDQNEFYINEKMNNIIDQGYPNFVYTYEQRYCKKKHEYEQLMQKFDGDLNGHLFAEESHFDIQMLMGLIGMFKSNVYLFDRKPQNALWKRFDESVDLTYTITYGNKDYQISLKSNYLFALSDYGSHKIVDHEGDLSESEKREIYNKCLFPILQLVSLHQQRKKFTFFNPMANRDQINMFDGEKLCEIFNVDIASRLRIIKCLENYVYRLAQS